ncbi:uncharacterized protein JN550_011927 [Neoarthrinium moseri]|uniref:uncharacterized protein n=1 Tax=Neoarthrinium moseri TaxID=1658444 RepID=UPI001FDC5DB8|nr:uncharacterized protein JN550_011927 [Neoarthrinium moseri]KAI1859619.1 hypothetical protein JN550_011927 [Neoarthrinium moseri]
MIVTRLISLTNFVVASSALGFQVFVLYPWHKQLDESFESLKKEHLPELNGGLARIFKDAQSAPRCFGDWKRISDWFPNYRWDVGPDMWVWRRVTAEHIFGTVAHWWNPPQPEADASSSRERPRMDQSESRSTAPALNFSILGLDSPALFLPFLATGAYAQQSAYGQCGGTGWTGATSCVNGYACASLNAYYYQCLPGTAVSSTVKQTSTTISSGASTTATGQTTSASASATTPPKTLVSGHYWIRAVESPNFHSYLQAAPTATPSPGPGDAYLRSATNAGQFNIVDGQLVYYTGSSTLYMGVENPANKTQRTLETRFDTTQNDYGTFAFQGDTVTWTVADISRPNTAAWLVCGDEGKLYINTGAYAYNTPAGCADETIHSYGGSTADI